VSDIYIDFVAINSFLGHFSIPTINDIRIAGNPDKMRSIVQHTIATIVSLKYTALVRVQKGSLVCQEFAKQYKVIQ